MRKPHEALHILWLSLSALSPWKVLLVDLKNLKKGRKVQCESCKLSFIWGKMKTAAWETALQMALRNSSKKGWGEGGQYICDFGEGGVHAIKH